MKYIDTVLSPGVVFVLIPLVYLLTAEYHGINQDCIAAALPAWRLANYGDLNLNDFTHFPAIAESNYGRISVVGPLLQIFSLPFYLAFPSEQPSAFPSTLAAVFSTSLTLFIMYCFLKSQATSKTSLYACLALGFCTPIWGVAAKQLWSHSVTILWISSALYFLAKNSLFKAGICFALLVMIRQITVIIPISIFVFFLVTKRDPKRYSLIIAPVVFTAVALLAYNYAVWGAAPTQQSAGPLLDSPASDIGQIIAGGYSGILGNLASLSFLLYLRRLGELVLDPHIGVFIWSPFILILLPGIAAGWKNSSTLVRAAALSGVLYILVHISLNRTSGGMVFNYRYPLETVVLLTPLFVNCYNFWVKENLKRSRIFFLSVLFSFFIQALYATNHYCVKDGFSGENKVSCYMF